jgi:hypothetical protein
MHMILAVSNILLDTKLNKIIELRIQLKQELNSSVFIFYIARRRSRMLLTQLAKMTYLSCGQKSQNLHDMIMLHRGPRSAT